MKGISLQKVNEKEMANRSREEIDDSISSTSPSTESNELNMRQEGH